MPDSASAARACSTTAAIADSSSRQGITIETSGPSPGSVPGRRSVCGWTATSGAMISPSSAVSVRAAAAARDGYGPPPMSAGTQFRRALAVAAERRAFRDLPADMPFDEAFEVATTRVGIGQQREEARWLFDRVRALAPKVVLEIGVSLGGTDMQEQGRLGRFSAFPLVRRAFAADRQRVELLLDVDSHAEATVERVRRLIGGRPVDFLFVDGDHSYDGVWSDVQLYGPLVRTGG